MSYFWIGYRLHDFLFKGLDTKSWEGITGICIGLLSMSLLYEGLHLLQQFHLNRFLKIRKSILSKTSLANNRVPSSEAVGSPRRRHSRRDDGSGEPAPRSLLEETDNHEGNKVQAYLGPCPDRSGILNLGVSSIIHSIYIFIGFTLMNAVMTFNVWVMLSICLGIGVGYFCFGNYRRVDHLVNPYGTETTSLDESDPVVQTGIPQDTTLLNKVRNGNGGGDYAGNGTSASTGGGDFESSRLIVGAQVHTPRVVTSSNSPS